MKSALTHCKNGHEMTPENTYIWVSAPNKKVCRTCSYERTARYRAALTAKRVSERQDVILARLPELSEAELGWAAGLFEGEGTVTITSGGVKGHTRSMVSITSTDKDVVEFYRTRWGGILRLSHKAGTGSAKSRDAWEWKINASDYAVLFVKQLLPYIRTCRVREKFELFIEISLQRRRGSRDPEYKARFQEYRERFRALNQRGTL